MVTITHNSPKQKVYRFDTSRLKLTSNENTLFKFECKVHGNVSVYYIQQDKASTKEKNIIRVWMLDGWMDGWMWPFAFIDITRPALLTFYIWSIKTRICIWKNDIHAHRNIQNSDGYTHHSVHILTNKEERLE